MPPKISILMPVHNGAKYLPKVIENILAQTFVDFELVMINDGSTDSSWRIMSELVTKDQRIKLITNTDNLGITKSLNIGLEKCQGKYIARADVDDLYDPDRLKEQYEFMEAEPDVALCGSLGWYIDEGGQKVGEKNLPLKYSEIKEKLLFNNQFIHSSLFIRKSILDKEGFYNESFKASQDYELVVRLARKYRLVNLPNRLVSWRVSHNSLSWSGKRQEWDAIRTRYWAITKYGYPKLKGLNNILLRLIWFVVPQRLKIRRYKK